MRAEVLILVFINFLYIWILPAIFFKKDGSHHFKWWMTAMPYILSPLFLVTAKAGAAIGLWSIVPREPDMLSYLSVVLSVLSISLIWFTIGTNRVPLSLWHQDNDAPRNIVTYGAYSRIRHPFYTSFLLALISAVCYLPQPVTFGFFFYGFFVMNATAKREERRLLESEYANEYRAYMERAGRFIPKFK